MKLKVEINVNWTALMPQISECLNELFSFGYTQEEIMNSLNDRHHWTESTPFRRQEFNFENARFTLTQLCNMVELLTGNDTSFADELLERIKNLLVEEMVA